MKVPSAQGTIAIENGTITIRVAISPPVFQAPVEGTTVSVERGALASKVTFHSPQGTFTATTVANANVKKILAILPETQDAGPSDLTTVRTYKNAAAYQNDLLNMQNQGWSVQSTVDHHRDRSLLYKLIMPFGIFSRGTSQIVVTYTRMKQ